MVEEIVMQLGSVTFDASGRASISNAYTFQAPFTRNPTVLLNSQNDQDYGYCAVIGIVRSITKINTLGLLRNNAGTYQVVIRGIAIGD